jgi:hypothetical protein
LYIKKQKKNKTKQSKAKTKNATTKVCLFVSWCLTSLSTIFQLQLPRCTSSNNKTLNDRLLARVLTDAITRNGAAAEIFCARLQSF